MENKNDGSDDQSENVEKQEMKNKRGVEIAQAEGLYNMNENVEEEEKKY
jgi:hypothetical protein